MKRNVLVGVIVLLGVSVTSVFGMESSDSAKTNTREKIETARKEALTRRTQVKDEYKAKLEASRTEWKTKREEMKTKLSKLNDDRKQKIVENTADRIANRNEHWVTHWNTILTRSSEIVNKLETRSQEAAKNGKDISKVTVAITSARTAIETAKSKVTVQAGKVYTVSVTDEASLGSNVKAAVSAMKVDVSAVIESINAARRAVQEIFKEIKLVVPETE